MNVINDIIVKNINIILLEPVIDYMIDEFSRISKKNDIILIIELLYYWLKNCVNYCINTIKRYRFRFRFKKKYNRRNKLYL